MTKISTYEQQANDFLAATNTTLECEFLENGKHFEDDEFNRGIYKITLTRGERKYSFNFGQSAANSQKYQDVKMPNRTYSTNGKGITGGYSINNIGKYINGGMNLKLIKGTPPTAYDVLAYLTKYPIYDFADFCSEYGYDQDSRKAYKTYKAVKREWENIAILYNDDQLEQLREIQ